VDEDPETPLDALAELLVMMQDCRRELLECERERLDRIGVLYDQWCLKDEPPPSHGTSPAPPSPSASPSAGPPPARPPGSTPDA
jgi:hypothetical protein